MQEEIARRKNKRPAAQKKAKTNRGKFSSKYALSERLVCGNCGSVYRRITWDIHGRKQIVWRCISRLEFGKKYCGESPSIPEEALHIAIMEAVKDLTKNHQQELISVLKQTLTDGISENLEHIEHSQSSHRLEELAAEFDRLLLLSDEENNFIDRRIKQVSEEISALTRGKLKKEEDIQKSTSMNAKVKEIISLLLDENLNLNGYSDSLVYRIIEKVSIKSKLVSAL